MRIISTRCTVVAGALKVDDPGAWKLAVKSFGDGVECELTLEEVGTQRSRAQNSYFHGPVLKAFEATGYTQAEAKEELCLRFLPREHTRLDGSVVTVPGHTSELNVEQMSAFLESCIQLAAELGIVIHDSETWRRHQKEAEPWFSLLNAN